MKKMWKIRKDKSAVSPVIATILMVAITVVLAAVLYVMVMGFGGSYQQYTHRIIYRRPTGTATARVNIGVIIPKDNVCQLQDHPDRQHRSYRSVCLWRNVN